ncbi:MAG: hypothetical protein FWD11_11390, partial [Micrococcales bacterium]|nr:hypothetical protein [Micrococcales bacterium]
MTDRRVLTAAAVLTLVTVLFAGCATSAPATLDTTEPARTEPEPTVTEFDRDCRRDVPPPGFPTDLLPVPPDAQLLLACAKPSDGPWEISLNVRTDQDTAGLLEAVRQPLAAGGFVEQPETAAVGVAAQTSFSRGEGEILL